MFISTLLFTGRIALKLVEKKSSIVHKSGVIAGVYLAILWTVQPLQSIAEAHCLGRKIGQQSGDVSRELSCSFVHLNDINFTHHFPSLPGVTYHTELAFVNFSTLPCRR